VRHPRWTDSLRRGARLFDEGAFFEAHEAWEEAWRPETDPARRTLLQGLIQVAAAFHKLLVMRSPEAAQRLLARGLAKLDGCPVRVAGVRLRAFREATRLCATALAEGRFERGAIPRLRT
jgi:predicted metal-dependent hydrolase